uniref:Putative homing endonuclease n=1 Tax=viral metagenome TaxID=1070528 RepID=A0A6M3L837_9ZZZZ
MQRFGIPRRTRSERASGELHWRWQGGRKKPRSGYILLYRPDHPRAVKRYVPEHILVWEETHHQSLPDGWEVHHINGIKDDNRSKNLLGMRKGKHRLIIPELQKRIQQLEAQLKSQGQLL